MKRFSEYLKETSTGPRKAISIADLRASIKNGAFTLDGSSLILSSNLSDVFNNTMLMSLAGCPSKAVGDFNCSNNRLTSLEGGPIFSLNHEGIATSSFYCAHNKLVSLKGAPLAVHDFNCSNNKLTSLEYVPQYINGTFDCSNNPITTLKDIHKQITEIGNFAMFVDCPIKSHMLGLMKIEGLQGIMVSDQKLERIFDKHLPGGDIFECQQDLIDAGYEDMAQL